MAENLRLKYADLGLSGSNLKNINAVVGSVNNILRTRRGERPFNREFGTRIEDYLHQPYSFTVSRLILSEVIGSIKRWEKRVTILPDTDVVADPDSRVYNMSLYVEVDGFPDPVLIEDTFNPVSA